MRERHRTGMRHRPPRVVLWYHGFHTAAAPTTEAERGERAFADGGRLMFLRREYGLRIPTIAALDSD